MLPLLFEQKLVQMVLSAARISWSVLLDLGAMRSKAHIKYIDQVVYRLSHDRSCSVLCFLLDQSQA